MPGALGRWSHTDQLNSSDQKFFNNSFTNSSNMTTSPASQVIMTDKDYRQIATNMFQGYADKDLEGKLLWESIKMDFKHWTKEQWDAINCKTWSVIKKYYIPRGV